MATWGHTNITIDGQLVKAQAPVIVSASRSTDIPAFYADWFFDRLEKDILHGLTHLMALSPTSLMTRHVLSYSGQRTPADF